MRDVSSSSSLGLPPTSNSLAQWKVFSSVPSSSSFHPNRASSSFHPNRASSSFHPNRASSSFHPNRASSSSSSHSSKSSSPPLPLVSLHPPHSSSSSFSSSSTPAQGISSSSLSRANYHLEDLSYPSQDPKERTTNERYPSSSSSSPFPTSFPSYFRSSSSSSSPPPPRLSSSSLFPTPSYASHSHRGREPLAGESHLHPSLHSHPHPLERFLPGGGGGEEERYFSRSLGRESGEAFELKRTEEKKKKKKKRESSFTNGSSASSSHACDSSRRYVDTKKDHEAFLRDLETRGVESIVIGSTVESVKSDKPSDRNVTGGGGEEENFFSVDGFHDDLRHGVSQEEIPGGRLGKRNAAHTGGLSQVTVPS